MSGELKSEFLDEFYSKKLTSRDVYNLRDIDGPRLSHYWGNGDTVLSVTWKRYKGIFYDVFNPDTYTVENYKEFKKYLQINNQYIFIGSIVLITPILFYVPFLIPRIARARREFLLHQYLKRKFYEQELKTGSKMVKLRDLKKILRNYHEKE